MAPAGVTLLLVQLLSCCGFLPPASPSPTDSEAVEKEAHAMTLRAHGFSYNQARAFGEEGASSKLNREHTLVERYENPADFTPVLHAVM